MIRTKWLTLVLLLLLAFSIQAMPACDDDDDTAGDDDDTTDDDDTVAGPEYPGDHDASWDCYLCHSGGQQLPGLPSRKTRENLAKQDAVSALPSGKRACQAADLAPNRA